MVDVGRRVQLHRHAVAADRDEAAEQDRVIAVQPARMAELEDVELGQDAVAVALVDAEQRDLAGVDPASVGTKRCPSKVLS